MGGQSLAKLLRVVWAPTLRNVQIVQMLPRIAQHIGGGLPRCLLHLDHVLTGLAGLAAPAAAAVPLASKPKRAKHAQTAK